MHLLVTRPQEDGERTAAAVRARGHSVVLAPLLRIEPIAADFGPEPFAAVLTTSANAARAVGAHARLGELRALPLYTVGHRSAEAARAAAFAAVHCAGGDVHDLIAVVAQKQEKTGAPLLYLAGEDRSVDLAAELGRRGLTVRTAVVYRAAAAERLPAEVEQAIAGGEIDGVLHYSRRSATAFRRCVGAADLRRRALTLTHFCLSAQIAEALADAANIRIAARPDEEALLALIGS